MNSKRLHIHSMPLVALTIAVTAVAVVAAVAVRHDTLAFASLRPAVRFANGDYGMVQVSPNTPESNDQPGATVQIVQDPTGVMQASQAVDTVMLHMYLDQAIKNKNSQR